MIILCIADKKPSKPIRQMIEECQPDMICTLGDLDYFILQDLEAVTNIPKLGVYGNHCSGNYFDDLGIIDMHCKTYTYNNMVFGGFEGSLKYKESRYAKMYTQEEAQLLLKDFPAVDVLLAHSPPYGINDERGSSSHEGFLALKEYVEKNKPRYLFHGHTYPTDEELITHYDKTEIIYVSGEKIVVL